jgi:hypothetical protein
MLAAALRFEALRKRGHDPRPLIIAKPPMSLQKLSRSSSLLFVAGSLFVGQALAQMTAPGPDFSGIWQLNDHASDSAAVITQRLHAERRREQAPSSRPAGASSSAAPASSSNGSGGHGGGRGMGGGGGGGMGGMGGGGHGGGRHGGQNSTDQSSSSNTPTKDPTPPLFANDAMLNVQQTSKGMRVDFNNNDRLDTQFDGIARQSLNGSAHVQTHMTANGMDVSMDFGDGTRLDQSWVRSPDGHHLTVTETWATPELSEPIVFTRSYDRLDL